MKIESEVNLIESAFKLSLQYKNRKSLSFKLV